MAGRASGRNREHIARSCGRIREVRKKFKDGKQKEALDDEKKRKA